MRERGGAVLLVWDVLWRGVLATANRSGGFEGRVVTDDGRSGRELRTRDAGTTVLGCGPLRRARA